MCPRSENISRKAFGIWCCVVELDQCCPCEDPSCPLCKLPTPPTPQIVTEKRSFLSCNVGKEESISISATVKRKKGLRAPGRLCYMGCPYLQSWANRRAWRSIWGCWLVAVDFLTSNKLLIGGRKPVTCSIFISFMSSTCIAVSTTPCTCPQPWIPHNDPYLSCQARTKGYIYTHSCAYGHHRSLATQLV